MNVFEKYWSRTDSRMLAGERKSSAWSIYMSSTENADILKLATRDEAEISGVGSSSSSVIEGVLIDRYIPEDKKARHCVILMYLTDAKIEGMKDGESPLPPNGILTALMSLCQDLSAGVRWQAAYPATKPLLAYLEDYFREKNPIQVAGDEERAERLASMFGTVLGLVETASEEELSSCPGIFAAYDGRALQSELASGGCTVVNVASFLSQFQPVIGNSTHTFRFLDVLLKSVDPVADTAGDRFKFGAFCDQFCSDWSRYDELLSERRVAVATVTYRLADGDSVELPEDYIILNPAAADSSSHVCVVGVRDAMRYGRVIHEPSGLRSGAPHFAYFLDKPVSALDDGDKEVIKNAALDVWPEFREVLDDEARSDDGMVRVCFFPVVEDVAAKWSSGSSVIHRRGGSR